MQSKEN
jgi:hypothetical protein